MELFGIPTRPDMEPNFDIRETDGSFVYVGPVTPPSSGPEQNPWEPVGRPGGYEQFLAHRLLRGRSSFWPVARRRPSIGL